MSIKDLNFENYRVNKPYPEVKANTKDPQVTKLIMDSYSGKKGEFTAISQYIYQHFILNNDEDIQNISKAMEEISINEMKHFEILSEILVSLGIVPKFCTYIDNNPSICNYWSAQNVNYTTNLQEFINYNIGLEKIAIIEYKEIVNITSSENIKEVILRIIEDEEEHLRFFMDVKKSL